MKDPNLYTRVEPRVYTRPGTWRRVHGEFSAERATSRGRHPPKTTRWLGRSAIFSPSRPIGIDT